MRIERTKDFTERTQRYEIEDGPDWVDSRSGVTKRVVGVIARTTYNSDVITGAYSEHKTDYRFLYKRVKKDGEFYAGHPQDWSWDLPSDVKAAVVAEVENYDA